MSITIEELNKLDKDTYQIIDIRDKEEVQKDEMPGAVYVPSDERNLVYKAAKLIKKTDYLLQNR